MQYRITDTSIIQINETSGTIQNVSNAVIEISNSADFTDTFLLYPLNKVSFTGRLFVRACDSVPQIIKVNVAPFVVSGSTSSGSGTAADIVYDGDIDGYLSVFFDFEDYLDGIFYRGDTQESSADFEAYLDEIWAEGA